MQLHHVSLFVRDAERSTRFYRDGLGLQILIDREFDGDWPGLFGVRSRRLRAVILGDRDRPHQVELVSFAEPVESGPPVAEPTTGTAILSFVGENPPAADDPGWKLEGQTGRTSILIAFPTSVAGGTKCWVTAMWYNRRGEYSPACPPLQTYLQVGPAAEAA